MRQNAKTVSPMSNEGRNQYVVEHITDALLKLMQSNDFTDISISQICEEAGVGRASFYRNFESKEDVISKHLKTLLDDWAKQYDGKDHYDLIESIFEHYWKHRELCILLYRQGLAHLSLQSIKEACGPKPEQPNLVAYTTAYFSYGLYGWIEEWFKRGMQETPKEMAVLWASAQEGSAKPSNEPPLGAAE